MKKVKTLKNIASLEMANIISICQNAVLGNG